MHQSRRIKLVRAIRDRLSEYGTKDEEGILQGIDRLIAEHKCYTQYVEETERLNKELQEQIILARQGHSDAQRTANRSLSLARKYEADSIRVRKALEALMKCFPAKHSEELNSWIEEDKNKWEKASS